MWNVLIYSNVYLTLKQRAIPFYVHLWYASWDMSSWFVSDNICILPYSHLLCSRIRKTIDKIWFKKILKILYMCTKDVSIILLKEIKQVKLFLNENKWFYLLLPFLVLLPFCHNFHNLRRSRFDLSKTISIPNGLFQSKNSNISVVSFLNLLQLPGDQCIILKHWYYNLTLQWFLV